MRRIGYLTDYYPALSHTFIRREAAALRARGLDVSTFSVHRARGQNLLTLADRKEAETTHSVRPISMVRLARAHAWALLRRPGRYVATLLTAARIRPKGAKAVLWRIFYFGEAIALAELLRDQRIDHLHNHFANSGADVGQLAARYLGIPWSLTLHGTSCFDYPSVATLGAKIRFARFVACVSDFGRAQAMRTVPRAYWDKLHVVRCGLDINQFASGRAVPPSNGRLRLLCVARLSEEKGVPILIAAVNKLVQEGLEVVVRVAGDGPERSVIQGQIRTMGLESHIQLLGAVQEELLIDMYSACDVFVLASLMEGLPVVLMEAMAAGKPCVAPSVGGIPELVVHGETGLLFNPGDGHALAGQVKRLASDPELARRLGEAGRRKVSEQHAIGKAVEPLLRLFTGDAFLSGEFASARPNLMERSDAHR